MPDTDSPTATEHEGLNLNTLAAWIANMKATYDQTQAITLTGAQRSQENNDRLNNVALQALQNAVETANIVGKNAATQSNLVNTSAANHANLAVDRMWNVDEASSLGAKTGVQQDALATLLAAAVGKALTDLGIVKPPTA